MGDLSFIKALARIVARQVIAELQEKRPPGETVLQQQAPRIEVTDTNSRRVSKLEIMSAAELARYLRIPVEAILAHVQSGTLPHRRIGLQYYFSRRAVLAWIEKGNVP